MVRNKDGIYGGKMGSGLTKEQARKRYGEKETFREFEIRTYY